MTVKLANIDTIKIGNQATCRMVVTAAQVDAFAEVSGDDNCLHMDEGLAQSLGFPGRVAHGMIALSAVSRLVGTQLPGHGSLWVSQETQFVAPVFVGHTLETKVTVERVSRAARLVELSVTVMNCDTLTVAVRGTVKVRIPIHQTVDKVTADCRKSASLVARDFP